MTKAAFISLGLAALVVFPATVPAQVNPAKLYQESVTLAQQIGSGIDVETQQAVAGLTSTRLALARDAQSRNDLHEADAQVLQVLKADPKNGAAIAFKQRNDQMIVAMKGRTPDAARSEEHTSE